MVALQSSKEGVSRQLWHLPRLGWITGGRGGPRRGSRWEQQEEVPWVDVSQVTTTWAANGNTGQTLSQNPSVQVGQDYS